VNNGTLYTIHETMMCEYISTDVLFVNINEDFYNKSLKCSTILISMVAYFIFIALLLPRNNKDVSLASKNRFISVFPQ
jgi:hypothetical protein